MITVWGGQTSRSIRVVWVLEEMGLPYRVRQVDMLAAEQDPEFLAVNPANYIPAIQDGEVVMVESIAIMEYLMARYGPTPLAPAPHDPAFPAYQQFLHLGEAGLATLMMPVIVSRFIAPEAERTNWGATWCPPCVREMPVLHQAQSSHPGVNFVFVNQGEPVDKVAAWLKARNLPLRNVLLDAQGQIGAAFKQRALPTTLFFNAKGELVSMRVGELSAATLTERLQALKP